MDNQDVPAENHATDVAAQTSAEFSSLREADRQLTARDVVNFMASIQNDVHELRARIDATERRVLFKLRKSSVSTLLPDAHAALARHVNDPSHDRPQSHEDDPPTISSPSTDAADLARLRRRVASIEQTAERSNLAIERVEADIRHLSDSAAQSSHGVPDDALTALSHSQESLSRKISDLAVGQEKRIDSVLTDVRDLSAAVARFEDFIKSHKALLTDVGTLSTRVLSIEQMTSNSEMDQLESEVRGLSASIGVTSDAVDRLRDQSEDAPYRIAQLDVQVNALFSRYRDSDVLQVLHKSRNDLGSVPEYHFQLQLNSAIKALESDDLYFDQAVVREALAAIEAGDPLLLTGPPGVGKTTLAQALPKLFRLAVRG